MVLPAIFTVNYDIFTSLALIYYSKLSFLLWFTMFHGCESPMEALRLTQLHFLHSEVAKVPGVR
jgi:hypothetical protein